MRRALANTFAAACLVLFALCAFMWVRGYAVADNLRHQDVAGFRGVITSRGDLALYSYELPKPNPAVDPGWLLQTGPTLDIPATERDKAIHHRSFLGFHFFRDARLDNAPIETAPIPAYRLRGWCLVLPYWFFTLLFGLVPLGRILRMSAQAPRGPRALPAEPSSPSS